MANLAFAQIVLFGSALALQSISVQAQNITTVVGGGIPSPTSGTSFSAGSVTAAAVDPTSGDLYFADATHGFIYDVNAHSGVPKLVETGSPITEYLYAFDLARPYAINSLAADGKGHLYVADPEASLVYEVATSGGTLQVVAGCGTINNPACHGQQTLGDGGPATSAYLTPASVAVDGSGNLFIADTNNCRIRKVTAGTISTVAGAGCGHSSGDGMAATLAGIPSPQGVAVDRMGNIFIADTFSASVREVCASSAGPCGGAGKIHTIAGGGTNNPSKGGPATAAALSNPVAVSVDSSGNLYITENNFGGPAARVSLVNTGFSPITIAPPTPTLPGCTSPVTPEVVLPGGIQTLAGSLQPGYMSIAPCQTSTPEGIPAMYTTLNGPSGVAVGGGLLLIADTANFRVRAINLTGTPVSPFGIQQNIEPYYVRTVIGNGQEEFILNGSSPTELTLGTPSAVVEDAALRIYIGENPARVLELQSAGEGIATIAGTGVVPNTTQAGVLGEGGLAVAAELQNPSGLFLDTADDVLIADGFGGAQGVNTSHHSRTIYGTPVGGGDIQNLAPAYTFIPSLVSDNASNLYFNTGQLIIATDPSLNIGNPYGQDNDPGYPTPGYVLGDKGPAANAVFGGISDQCLDAAGNIFITDSYTFGVRLVAIGSQATVGSVSVQPNYIDSVAGGGGQLPPSTLAFTYDNYFQHAYYTAEQIGDGGPATSAFVAPAGCFVDDLGNIFLADAGNDRIRRIDRKTGTITTVAGGQYPGFSGDGGPAVDASLNSPKSVWGDQQGNLLISDSGNHRIRKISGILPVPKARLSSSNPSLNNPSPGSVVQVTLTNIGTAPLVLSSAPTLTDSKDFSMSTSGCPVGLPGLTPNPSNASGIPGSTCTVSVTPLGKTASTEVMFFDNSQRFYISSGVSGTWDINRSGQASGYVQSQTIHVNYGGTN